MKKFVKFISFLMLTAPVFLDAAEKRSAEKEVFSKWLEMQTVIEQMDIKSILNEGSENIFLAVKAQSELSCNMLKTILNMCGLIPDKSFVENLNMSEKFIDNPEFCNLLKNIYNWLQNDVDKFVKYLIETDISSAIMNGEEEKLGIELTLDKYLTIFQRLFWQRDPIKQYYFLFTVANNFFEYCFSAKTFPKFKELISKKENHPIARLIYSITWQYLAGMGWKHWHQNSINKLKQEAKRGQEMIYIAGGSDIYQLIKNGIYNIRIIDPILPTQPKYYSEGWAWLWKGEGNDGGIGDEIKFNFEEKKILMRRVYFLEERETFRVMLANGYEVDIAKSITKWDVLRNGKIERKLGTVVIDRRLTNQNDFSPSKKQTLLMSFNELYFIALPPNNGGWGIDPNQFNKDLSIVIKQLAKPVDTQLIRNMRTVLEEGEFKFIALGTCIN